MSVELVTGYKGEPHISSADVSNLLQGIIGENIVVLNVGNKMAANPISANEIDIEDGGAVFQGKHFVIPAGDIEPCIIQNGSQGTYRRDLIVAHYVKSLETSVESVEIKVLKGTEAQTKNAATAPTYITGNIWEGATVVEAPLYEVLLNGINIESITPKYDVMMSAEETKAEITQINADLTEINSNLSDSIKSNGLGNMHIAVKYIPNLSLKNETQISVADVIPSDAINFFVIAAVAGEYYIPYVGNNAGDFSFLSFDAHSATNRTILLRASSDFSAYTRNTYVILAYYTGTLP